MIAKHLHCTYVHRKKPGKKKLLNELAIKNKNELSSSGIEQPSSANAGAIHLQLSGAKPDRSLHGSAPPPAWVYSSTVDIDASDREAQQEETLTDSDWKAQNKIIQWWNWTTISCLAAATQRRLDHWNNWPVWYTHTGTYIAAYLFDWCSRRRERHTQTSSTRVSGEKFGPVFSSKARYRCAKGKKQAQWSGDWRGEFLLTNDVLMIWVRRLKLDQLELFEIWVLKLEDWSWICWSFWDWSWSWSWICWIIWDFRFEVEVEVGNWSWTHDLQTS